MAIANTTYGLVIVCALTMAVSCRPQNNAVNSTTQSIAVNSTFEPSSDPQIYDSNKSNQLLSNRKILIEEFKTKVMRHLNWKTPVNDNPTHKLPNEVIAHLNQQHALSDAKLKEDIIIRPSNNNCSCLSSMNCSRFEFIATQSIETLLSVQLLFYKTDIMKNLSVTIYSSMSEVADPVIKLKEYHSKSKTDSGLVAFELPKILALEFKNGEVTCTAEIEGSSGDFSPILILTKTIVKEEKSRRTVRSIENCNDCCIRESFKVTVEELGWESWVVEPREFNIGNCVGHCTETHTFYKSQYQTIRNILSKRNDTRFPRPDCAFWSLKCQPNKLLAQGIMYDNNGTVIYDQIPDIAIDSCHCS